MTHFSVTPGKKFWFLKKCWCFSTRIISHYCIWWFSCRSCNTFLVNFSSMNISSLVTPTQPSLKGSKIPNGHIQLNSKYHDSEISKKITGVTLLLVAHQHHFSQRRLVKTWKELCCGSKCEKRKKSSFG